MKNILFTLLIITNIGAAQSIKFGVLTNLRFGNSSLNSVRDSVVEVIDEMESADFIVIPGNLTENGTGTEMREAADFTKSLGSQVLAIPGDNESKYRKAGFTYFRDNFEENHFAVKRNGFLLLGISASSRFTDFGHFTVEELDWLKSEIDDLDEDTGIILFCNYPLSVNLDNREKLGEIFSGKNLRAIISCAKRPDINPQDDSFPQIILGSENVTGVHQIHVNDAGVFLSEFTIEGWQISDSVPNKEFNFSSTNEEGFTVKKAAIVKKIELGHSVETLPLIYNDKYYFYDKTGLLTCYDTSFTKLWDYDAFGDINGSPVAKDGFLTLATFQGDLFALEAETGMDIQSIGFDEILTTELLAIEYTGSRKTMVPKQTDSKAAVIFGTDSGRLYCFDMETLEEIWRNDDAKDAVEGKPVEYNNKIVFTSRDGFIYCVDTRTGWLVWKYKLTSNPKLAPVQMTPVFNENKMYITSRDGITYAMDFLLGRPFWKKDKYNARESIGISRDGKFLYVKAVQNHMHILEARTGNWMVDRRVKFGLDTSPTTTIEVDGRVLFPTAGGMIYSIDRKRKVSKLIQSANAPLLSLRRMDENQIMSINIDGQITVFRTKF